MDATAARFADRNAGGYSKCDSRALGDLRDGAVAPRLSFSIPQTLLRLDTPFHRADLRPVHVCRRNHYSRHDFANHNVGLPRNFAQRSRLATRGRLRSGCNPLGGDADCGAKLRKERTVRSRYSWSGTRAWRNDGGHDGHRQHAADRSLTFQARLHACQRNRQ